MGRRFRFLSVFTVLFAFFYINTGFATTMIPVTYGYYCPEYKTYTSCKANYYMSGGTGAGNSCKACGANSTSSGGQVTTCNCNTGYSSNGTALGSSTSTTGCSLISVTCFEKYYLKKGQTTCSACPEGYYCPGGVFSYNARIDQGKNSCPSGYTSNLGEASASSGCYILVSGGRYIQTANSTTQQKCAAGTYKEEHIVYYGKTSSCSVCGDNTYSSEGASSCASCFTTNGYGNSGTSASSHAKETSCKLTCEAGTYVAASRAACIPVGKGFWRGEHTVSQGSISTRNECPDTYNYGSETAGSQSECATRCVGGTYVDIAGGTCLSSSPGGKCEEFASGKCVSVDDGYYRTSHVVYYGQASEQKLCPENYRDGGPAAMLGDCVGRFLKTGTQVEGDIPENCTEVTEWNDCVPPTCYYEQNYNKIIIKDCSPGTCTKRPNAVKADANYYDGDGTYCPACSTVGDGTFTLSDPGNEGGNTRCYKNCSVPCIQQECPANASCTHGQETSTGREYYSSVSTFCNATPKNCSLTFTCNAGYKKNEEGTACEPLSYVITYRKQKGGGIGSILTQNVTYNTEFKTKPADTFKYPGYKFVDWGGKYPQPNTTYTYLTPNNISLIATWEACPANPNAAGTCDCELKEFPNGSGCSSCNISCSKESVFNLGSYNVCNRETSNLCYRNCTTLDVTNSTSVDGNITKGGTNNCVATSCKAGYYLTNNVCATCVANATCSGGTDSFTCNTGYHVSDDGSQCEPNVLSITLKKNGGTGNINGSEGSADATQQCKFGILCNLPSSGLERYGYAFTGWGASEDCTSGVLQKTFTQEEILYACWSQQTTQCQKGKFYNGYDHITCPEGSYCPGTGFANIGTEGCVMKCPDGGTSNAGAGSDLECYLPCAPTLEIENGQGLSEGPAYYTGSKYQSCTYRAECDEGYTAQNSPSTAPSCVWENPNDCPEGYYCPPDSPTPLECPNGGTSEKGSTEITQCYKIFDDYVGFYNGSASAKCLYQTTTTDYTACTIIEVTSCDAGYWYKQNGDFSCVSVTSGYYSPDGETVRTECPIDPLGNKVGSNELASDYTDCYKTCDIDVLHSTEIVAESDTVYAVSADSYEACSFNVTCETGYTVISNNTENPYCKANEYTITLNKNGGTGTTPASITCTFNSGTCNLPSISGLSRRGYSAQDKWCVGQDGTGPCYYAGQSTATNISETGTDITLYAVWTPNRYTINLDSQNANLNAVPNTVYLKYETGWFNNSAATTPITKLSTVPTKLGYEFTGFYSEKTGGVQLISSNGVFETSEDALSFTATEPSTIYARWASGSIYCEPGTYYAGTGTKCQVCLEGYYCPGGYFPTDSGSIDQDSIKACDISWPFSLQGSKEETDCYRNCENKTVVNGTAIPENEQESYPNTCTYKTGISDAGNPCDIINNECVETSCQIGYEMKNRVCVECNREYAISYKEGGVCQVKECVLGYHPNGDRCEQNVQTCTAPNATFAERTWDYKTNSFGPCTIRECDYGYHIASNACVSDVQPCNIENGTGFKEWDTRTNKWGICIATACDPGYTNDPSETNQPNKQCGECKNKYNALGELAVSSYVHGCEIASCMYQGELYNLENNECVQICPREEYSDETGTMVWDESRKKCVHTCNDGYTMW